MFLSPDTLNDEEIEEIYEEGHKAGSNDLFFNESKCPYERKSESADIWLHAYRNAYAMSRGY
jgi:hypothetical protein